MSRSNNDERHSKGRLPNAGKPVLVPDEPFQLDLRRSGDEGFTELEGKERMLTAIFQGLGAASVCWTESPNGVFMAQRAEQIGMAIMAEIERYAESQ